jgi:membrane protein implicated in regulation of membrane protease activity
VRIQFAALGLLVANAAALLLYLIGVGLPLWWWAAVAAFLGLLVVAAQWRRCVPSSLQPSRSRSQGPPAPH